MTIDVGESVSKYWTALQNTKRLALHATIYTWAASQTPPGWVLDLGCEYGFGSLLIAQTNPKLQVLGMDLYLASVQYAQQLPFDTKIPLVNADAAHLPVATETFSGIYLINLLHLVKEPGRVLSEVQRALRSGGVAMIGIHLDENRSSTLKLVQQLELEIETRFAQVTYPQEIYGQIPSFPSQSFVINQEDSTWVALCRKG